jgi:hypothetical protein
VARQFGLAASTVRAIDLRYLERWAQGRRRPALRQMRVDEIYLGIALGGKLGRGGADDEAVKPFIGIQRV